MRKRLSLVLAAVTLQGCLSIPTADERAQVGTTYELTGPWCNMRFADGLTALTEGQCFGGPGIAGGTEIPSGACIVLGKPHLSKPSPSRVAVFEVSVAKQPSRIVSFNLPGEAHSAKTIVRKDCTPE